uniref:NADH-ubiquinone oxidoreductase chain 6 n=1 Tax=Neochauliodes fraternus TaxID=1447909 RepID=A0A088BQJ9_9NEOP|nr:NADH dehydrogenase subunit 6 [Neochauliodes fraternus]AHG24703.1 NADH dehydrogenase subunit 6 [Neochauliodes fraternus]
MIHLIMFMNLIITWNFIQMNHPLAMGMILLLQTINICLTSGMLIKTFWFSYILFLIMLGGMLVLFIYMTSLASNELFSISMKNFLFNISLMIILILITLIEYFQPSSIIMNVDMNIIENINYNENSMNLIKLYNFPTMNLSLLLINYLFLTLIIVVKITNIFFGPLRQMN